MSDPEQFRRVCVDATAAILLIVLPVSVGVAVLAGPFVRLLLGPNWGDAVPVIQVLAFAGAISALTSNNVSAYLALGRPHLATAILGSRMVVLAAMVAWLSPHRGVLGVAYAELIAATASLLVSLPTLFTTVHLHIRQYLAASWRPALASVLMGAVILWLDRPAFDAGEPLRAARSLFLGTALGAIIYPIMLAGLWWLAGKPQSVEVVMVRQIAAFARQRFAGTGSPAA